MAKLSAHNRKELIRLEKEIPVKEDDDLTYDRRTLAFMSDGKILEKRDVVFKPKFDWDSPQGRRHTWGWKVKGKAKEGLTPERFAEIYSKIGYVVKG